MDTRFGTHSVEVQPAHRDGGREAVPAVTIAFEVPLSADELVALLYDAAQPKDELTPEKARLFIADIVVNVGLLEVDNFVLQLERDIASGTVNTAWLAHCREMINLALQATPGLGRPVGARS